MNYLVFSEIIFFAVYSVEVYKADAATANVFLLTAIIYACLKLLFYIFYDKNVGRILSVLVLLMVGISAWFIYPMALFFPLSLNQFNQFVLKNRRGVPLLGLIWIFALPTDFITVYFAVFAFSLLIVTMQKEYGEKTKKTDDKMELLRRKHLNMEKQLETYVRETENITYQSQLEERNKLSQALHDELGHTLSGNILRLEAVKLSVDTDAEKSKSMLQEVIRNLREGMDLIRSILKSAKPEVSTVNLANLQIIIDNVSKQSNVNIKVKHNSDINNISQSMWQVIIPNIKEALTNMMKYSNAQNCEIEFTKLNKIYRVSVQDDGTGAKQIVKGLGLLGIEERMAQLGGNAIFDAGNGFSVTMIFPIASPN